MSDDRRKNARLQGRFSNNPKESHEKKKEQKNSDKQNSGKNKSGNEKNQPLKSIAAEGINVEYQENSNISIPELSKKKPEEIRNPGFTILSKTNFGKSEIYYEPGFIEKEEANQLYVIYKESTPWVEKNIIIHGKEYPQPRKVAWYGELDYAYSGAVLEATPMPQSIFEMKNKIEQHLNSKGILVEFNSVLLNYYKDEHSSVAWHSDDELSMGVHPIIASISLGEMREFQMRPKIHVKEVDTQYYVNLTSGSLLVMMGCMQRDWQHQIPKASHNRTGRVNLTFRNVFPNDLKPSRGPSLMVKTTELVSKSEARRPNPVDDLEDFPSLGESVQLSASSKPDPASEPPEALPESVDLEPVGENGSHPVSDSTTKDTKIEEQSAESETDLPDQSASSSVEASGSAENVPFQNNVSRAHQLNVNAPDFIPSNPAFLSSYRDMNLEALASLGDETSIGDEDVFEFWYCLQEKMFSPEHQKLLSWRDKEEIECYSHLAANSLEVENQRIINKRACKIVLDCYDKIISKNFNRRPDLSRKPPRNAKGFRNRF